MSAGADWPKDIAENLNNGPSSGSVHSGKKSCSVNVAILTKFLCAHINQDTVPFKSSMMHIRFRCRYMNLITYLVSFAAALAEVMQRSRLNDSEQPADRVCKRTQHVTSNNVMSVCKGL